MLLDLGLCLVALAFVAFVGLALRVLLLPALEIDPLEALATDYGTGAVAVTLWMLLLTTVQQSFALGSISAPLALVALAVLLSRRLRTATRPPRAPFAWTLPRRFTDLVEFAPVLGLALVIAGASYLALTRPETNWDTLSHWGLKAKAFWVHGTVWLWDYDAHNYYPLLVPLLTTWVYTLLGRVDEVLAKTVSLGYGVALVLLCYRALRHQGQTRFAAGAFTLLLLLGANQLVQQLLTNQADLPLTFYLAGAIVNAWWWLKKPLDWQRLVLAGLFAGGAAWTKYEGLFLVALVGLSMLVVLWLDRRPPRLWLRPLAAFVAALAAPSIAWAAYRMVYGIPVEGEHIAALFIADRWFPVLGEAARYLLTGRSAGLWVAVFGGWLLFARRSLTAEHRFLTMTFALNLAAIVWAFDVTAEDPLGQVQRAGGRLLMHIAPLGILLLASLIRAAAASPEPETQPLLRSVVQR